MSTDMEGRVALVTGGSSGIGRTTAVEFGRQGCSVVVAARRVAEGEETCQLVVKAGGRARFVQTDITKAADVWRMVDETVASFGGIDFAFNNAAHMSPLGPFPEWHDVTEEAWDAQIDTGLKGVWLSMKYQLPAMIKRGGGAIVNNSSVAALVGTGGGAYSAVKHGVIGLTRTAAIRYGNRNIRVNAVCPGIIGDTHIWSNRTSGDLEFESALVRLHPAGRLGTEQDVAEAVIWLCSEKSSFITGEYLVIDGGLLVKGPELPMKKQPAQAAR